MNTKKYMYKFLNFIAITNIEICRNMRIYEYNFSGLNYLPITNKIREIEKFFNLKIYI